MNDDPDGDVLVFMEALRLPVAARSDYLDRACAGDADLRRHVEALLRGFEKAGNFLEKPAEGLAAAKPQEIATGEKAGDWTSRTS
jgi:eukaryotic-like serine/threonine-protein kinase